MELLGQELRKIWRPGIVAVLAVLGVLYYLLFPRFYVEHFHNGPNAQSDFDIAVGWMERFGPTMEPEERAQVDAQLADEIAVFDDMVADLPEAAAAGIVAGQSDKILEVISEVTPAQRAEIRVYLADHPIVVKPAEGDKVFDILITLRAGNNHVKLRISDYHTHIVYIEKNGEVLFQSGEVLSDSARDMLTDRSCLSVEGVLDFASTCNLEDVRALIERQIDYNYAIAEEGMRHSWGANIGSVLKEHYGVGIYSRARYMAAAGSDARMSGCEMPVIIVSGSGNQGITASVPVVEYAKELNVSRDQMVRAVLLSDLLTIHLKTGIGRLSAYCGAVSAGCSAGAAIAYLHGGGFREIAHTLVNSLAIVSGMICDGAKASCAAKISAAVDAGLVGYSMFRSGQQFRGGDGIVTKGVEETIRNIGRLGRLGMRETDREIIRIMTNQPASEEAD